MTTAAQMTAARKAVRNAIKAGLDQSAAHKMAIETLVACGMKDCIVSEMATKALIDVVCG